jgi:hypothetical protein
MAEFVGEKIRRSIIDDEGDEIGYSICEVAKWVPAKFSDVSSERSGKLVEFWQVKPVEYCLYKPQGDGIEYAVR